MTTKREQVLSALYELVKLTPHGETRRGGELPTRIPAAGLIVLRDGEPGEPDVTLCPLIYEYRHRAEIEVFVQPPVGTDVNEYLDNVLEWLGATLGMDRTLGGLCEWVEPGAPVSADLALEGTAGIIAAIVPVELIYTTTGPLA